MKTLKLLAILSAFFCFALLTDARGDDAVKVESYDAKYVYTSGPDAEKIGKECDAIVGRLIARYGAPRVWIRFPVQFSSGGGSVAGYTLYTDGKVGEVVVYQPFDVAKGGTLDHEITHAFFFYFLDSNFDLFLNEGLAQNSEYRRREYLRNTVYERYARGDFVPLSNLYGTNRYDGSLLTYHQGFSVVDFLIAKGGSKWFAAFLDALSVGVYKGDVDAALKAYYGYDGFDEMERDWIRYVESGQDRSTVRTLILE